MRISDHGAAATEDPARTVVTGLAKIGLALRHGAWQSGARAGLTPTQAQILGLLRFRAGVTRVADLARELAVTQPTVSDAVSALVAKGLVERRPLRSRGRSAALALTPAGERAADEGAGWADFLLAGVDALDARERALLLRALVKIVRTLQRQGRIPVARMCVDCRFFRPYVHDDPESPHHCQLVDAPFGDGRLRIDCADHEALDDEQADEVWLAFTKEVA